MRHSVSPFSLSVWEAGGSPSLSSSDSYITMKSPRRSSNASSESRERIGRRVSSKSRSSSNASVDKRDGGDIPLRYTPVTGRVSRAKKGVPVHVCEECQPPKRFTRAEHLRRHRLSHQPPDLACSYPNCSKVFHRKDLLERHQQKHEQEGDASSNDGSQTNEPISERSPRASLSHARPYQPQGYGVDGYSASAPAAPGVYIDPSTSMSSQDQMRGSVRATDAYMWSNFGSIPSQGLGISHPQGLYNEADPNMYPNTLPAMPELQNAQPPLASQSWPNVAMTSEHSPSQNPTHYSTPGMGGQYLDVPQGNEWSSLFPGSAGQPSTTPVMKNQAITYVDPLAMPIANPEPPAFYDPSQYPANTMQGVTVDQHAAQREMRMSRTPDPPIDHRLTASPRLMDGLDHLSVEDPQQGYMG